MSCRTRYHRFTPGSTRADADGNVWIRTLEAIDGESIYDVIDRSGSLSDRVFVPPGRVIVGFGPDGAVFMAVSESGGVRLERSRYRKGR